MQAEVYPGEHRACRDCGITKSISDFYMRTKRADGRPMSYCKECSKARSIANWRKNLVASNARRNERRRTDPSIREREQLTDPFGKTRRANRARARVHGVAYEDVDYQSIIDQSGMICGICNLAVERTKLTFDHIIPMSRGGPHIQANLQVAHRACNAWKRDRLPGEHPKRQPRVIQCPNCTHQFIP